MNKLFIRIVGVIIASFIFGSCASESDEILPTIPKDKTFYGKTLKLSYCGETMPAKTVTVNSDNGSANKVLMTCRGVTDLSQLSAIGMSGIAPAPGVLPGSSVLSLPIQLKPDGDKYDFSGSGTTDFCSYQYSGYLTDASLTIKIKDVVLSEKTLAGKIFKPTPYKTSGLQTVSSPFHLVWELDPALGIDINLTPLLEAFVTLPFIPTYHDTAYSSITQLLSNSLQTIAFLENGNIVFRYFSNVGGATQLVTSVGNTFQYVVTSGNTLKLYPNPTTLFGRWLVAQSNSEGIPDISFTKSEGNHENSEINILILPLIKELVPYVLTQCRDGIPFEFNLGSSGLEIYLNTPTILNIVQHVILAIENDRELQQIVFSYLTGLDELAGVLSELKDLLPTLKAILEASTKVEIGLSLKNYQ